MANRADLHSAFKDYQQRFPYEIDTVTQFTNFVQAHSDCFERSLQIGHITGSAWVINRSGTCALFTLHRKLGLWLQLGGHADGNPDVAQVAMREAQEESGLTNLALVEEGIFDLDAHTIPARGSEPAHIHYDVRYLIQATSEEPLSISEESHDLAWFSLEEIKERFQDESILRMAKKWQNG
ncbi:MAG: NUDIX hydrolase [Chloroflexota bacterium]